MNERLEMTCEGCADRFVYDEPVVSIADFLRAAIAEGWREIEEQEIIPAVRTVIIQNSFDTGEISPYTLARTDLAKYKNACERLENFIPLVTGGITRRPGMRFIVPALGPSRREQVAQHFKYSFVALFDALCPACVAQVKEHRRVAALRQPQ